eukprot:3289534-Ditylum_brightwellii.AAC.1
MDMSDADSTVGSDSDEKFDIEEETDRIICNEYEIKNGTVSPRLGLAKCDEISVLSVTFLQNRRKPNQWKSYLYF